jgi:hypothetical protein
MEDKLRVLQEDLEEIIIRLHYQLRQWEEDYDQWKKNPRFGEQKKKRDLTYDQYRYYEGKFYAYFFVLEHLGSGLPRILTRLRGIEFKGNQVIETKMHYTEIYGHFESDKVLRAKKIKK